MNILELKNDISYLKEKRDDELQRFNDLINSDGTDERIYICYKSLLLKQNQLKLAEDAMVVYMITKNS